MFKTRAVFFRNCFNMLCEEEIFVFVKRNDIRKEEDFISLVDDDEKANNRF